jgi:hypothetical protein
MIATPEEYLRRAEGAAPPHGSYGISSQLTAGISVRSIRRKESRLPTARHQASAPTNRSTMASGSAKLDSNQ